MGADLYIKPITEKANAKYNPLFNRAVEIRNELNKELEVREHVVKSYKEIPAWTSQFRDANGALEVTKQKLDEAQAKVSKYYDRMYPSSGYFRDSYNGTSILNRLGLSWWRDIPSGNLSAEQLQKVIALVKSRKLPACTEAELRAKHCTVDNGENSVKVWQRHFRNKKRQLIRFLERAEKYAAKGEQVYFSL